MRYRLWGQTRFFVSELCLGTMTYGGNGGIWEAIGKLRQDAVNAQVKAAFEAGVNFIDTADGGLFSLQSAHGIRESGIASWIREAGGPLCRARLRGAPLRLAPTAPNRLGHTRGA